MLKLTKGTTNSNLVLTLAEKATLSPVYYLMEFINDMTETKYYVRLIEESTELERYNLFTIVEGVNDPLGGSIVLGDEGFYSYNVYEQSSAFNLNPDGLTIVESGKMKLLGDNQTFTKNNITTSYIAHDPTT